MSDELEDFGLFGPKSVAWRIHAHPSGWVGAIRALLLQALEPRAMAGVAQFSRFSEDAWRRFQTTSDFVMVVTYRSRSEAEGAISKVRSVHESIVGVDPYTGQPFDANDPYLLAYVHNCLVDSLLVAYVNIAGGLSRRDQDRYVDEMAVLAELIGADTAEIPRTAASLSRWMSSQSGLLLTAEAQLAAETIRRMNLPRHFRPAWGLAWNASMAFMPSYALELYGFERDELGSFVSTRLVCLAARILRAVLPSHPYYREAKYAYYDYYSRQNGTSTLSCLTRLVTDLSSTVESRY